MACFPCNGVFIVTLQDRYFDCVLNHSLDHVPYKDIKVPEKWCDFITKNHKLGPTVVSVPCFIQLVNLNPLVKIWHKILLTLRVEMALLSLRKWFVMLGYTKAPSSGSVLTTQSSQPASGANNLVLMKVLRCWR